MAGQAIDGTGDPHLAAGIHYRMLTHPLLGLPVVPVVIGKTILTQLGKGHTRTDVTWIDSHGTVLTPPFAVTQDNPVTGYLPLGQTCCWAAVEGRAAARFPPHAATPFRVEGVVVTPFGDAPVAVRSRTPYHVYASHIERVIVRGSGTVTGLSWLPASAVDVFERFRTAPLPIGPGTRYAGPPDGEDEGFSRVKRGAPKRFGMHESPLASAPTGCAPATAADEVGRVTALTGEPSASLDALINDTSAPQGQLSAIETVIDDSGKSLGTSERLLLMDLLHGAVDPGIARWLGFLDMDESAPDESIIVAYVVDALFAPDWKGITDQRLLLTLLSGTVVTDGARAVRDLATHAPELLAYAEQVGEMTGGPFLQLRVVLAASGRVPLDSPPAPAMGGPASGDWLPALAPAAIREITTELDGLVPAAGIASVIAQPSGGVPAGRNPEQPAGRRLLLTARPDDAVTTVAGGVLADRLADERDGSWQVAQADWFGRWSGWARQGIAAAARPRPPRPAFTLTTTPPGVPVPVPAGPLAGRIRIEVSVPPAEGLPSGGRLLDQLVLTVTTSGGPVQTAHPLPTPNAPPEALVIRVDGPALLPTESQTVTVTARWQDSAGVTSDESDPKQATFYDPRPPAPVVIPPALAYTARPDATGRARATLTWAPIAGQASFRVFVADETTLRAKLEDTAAGALSAGDAGQAPGASQAQALLASLDAAADAPARGAIWDANRASLPRRWWLQLTAEPVPAPSSGPAVFTHDVSGSLSVLVLYRVVAVSAASVESDFRTSPLLPRAVPNLLVPPVPALDVLPVTDGSGNLQARLTVTVPAGPTPAVWYRLRRATATSDAELMPVVAEGPVPPRPVGDPAPQVVAVVEPGGPRTSLSAWSRYTWRVEVRGPAAPGGGPAGDWSSPSPPAQAAVMPPDPPPGVENLSATRDGAGVHIRFTHPDPLAAGGSTGYVVDVYRQLAGESLRLLRSLAGQEPPPAGRGADVTGSFDIVDDDASAVTGTLYRVVVTDPLGRASPPSPPVEAP
jgi:hypothetical protein